MSLVALLFPNKSIHDLKINLQLSALILYILHYIILSQVQLTIKTNKKENKLSIVSAGALVSNVSAIYGEDNLADDPHKLCNRQSSYIYLYIFEIQLKIIFIK